ncbi:hypothetical protein PMIN04_008106 [Paraphaeosphaeria minitans]
MVEAIGDRIETQVDPALVDGIGDSERKSQFESNVAEIASEGSLPTQEELATLQRVPAKIPWRGK